METTMKICSSCKKPLDRTSENFNKNASAPDGFDYYCKKCKNEKQRTRYDAAEKPEKPKAKIARRKRSVTKPIGSVAEPLNFASPTEIVNALSKGVAREIITLIEHKFGIA